MYYNRKLWGIVDQFEAASKKEKVPIITRFIEELKSEGYQFVDRSHPPEIITVTKMSNTVTKVRQRLRNMVNRNKRNRGDTDEWVRNL